MKKRTFVFVIVLAIIAAGVWFYSSKKPKETETPPETESGFGSEIIGKISENSTVKVPETNPFNKEINPIEGVYKNPFGQ